ncbi:MAG TPA: dihydrofolate reductase family protein [Candidatus Paceibacterota bacterium]|nr:dihydrofolate reductase family protein [Candidatus Paceibacterota bacterium]
MAHVFIIAAQTVDGFIAKDSNHPAFWTSKEDKKKFVELTQRAGVCVMGSSTFKTLPRPLKERLNVVYSRSEKFEGENVETTNEDPIALVKRLEDRGYKEIAICGGSSIYSLFLKAGVVDTLYITIEPLLFGKGMTVFTDDMNLQLELKNLEKTEAGTLMLEYKVKNKTI